MPVLDHMTPAARVRMVTRDTRLKDAARHMKEDDTGVLPVNDGEKLVGMITDRDIAIRGVAEGKNHDATVGEVMTDEVLYAYSDAECEDVIANMRENAIRRLPIVDREKNFQGMVSITDMCDGHAEKVGEALAVIHDKPPQK